MYYLINYILHNKYASNKLHAADFDFDLLEYSSIHVKTFETVCTTCTLSPMYFVSITRDAAISSHKVGVDSSSSIP